MHGNECEVTRGCRWRLLEILGSDPRPTALFCKSDFVARDVTRHLQALEFRIPEDVSVVGFGDEGLEFAPGRRLTSVWVDSEGMGRTAAQYILREINGQTNLPHRRVLPTHVVQYDSVAELRPEIIPAAGRNDDLPGERIERCRENSS